MYIVFEGIVGSGKTTQVKKLVEYLSCHSSLVPVIPGLSRNLVPSIHPRFLHTQEWQIRNVLHVREPGSTPIAEDIRYLAQGKEWQNEVMHPLTNAYLYAAARAQTLHTIVAPALERGDIVISDRSFLSSCAIQGEVQWVGMDRILKINEQALNWVLPDIIFYLDIDIDLALSRTFDVVWDKFEREERAFYEAIIRWYEKCEKLEIMKDRFIMIDANGNEEAVFEQIVEKIMKYNL